MPLHNHVRRHYEARNEQAHKEAGHRDALMKHHNMIKRRVITLARQCCHAPDAETKSRMVQDFLQTTPDTTLTRPRKKPRKKNPSHGARPELRVLDLGCGKGGDIFKWHHEEVTQYTGVDICESSIAQARDRVALLPWEGEDKRVVVEFELQDMVDFLKGEAVGCYDVISLQFVIHYAVDNEARLFRLLDLCKHHLAPGGVIIGTMVNSERAASLFKRGRSDYFGLTPLPGQSKSPDEIGYAYEFYLRNCVDNCIEYVVPWARIQEEAAKAGFVPDYHVSFDHEAFADEHELHSEQKLVSGCCDAFQLSHRK